MNDQKITQAFGELTAQADGCRVERNVREQYRKKNHVFEKRPIRAITILAAVLAMIMIPAAAFGIVYGYHASHAEDGYFVTAEGIIAPIRLADQKLQELGQYAIRFENGVTAPISDFGKTYEDYDALDAWLGGVLLTSPMLDGSCVLYCTADNTGSPVFAHVSGTNTVKDRGQVCAVSITVPLVDVGEEIGWETKYADMLSAKTIHTENGMSAELVTTETSVTAYFIHGGIQYRLNIAGNHEEAAAVLTEIISTMK